LPPRETFTIIGRERATKRVVRLAAFARDGLE